MGGQRKLEESLELLYHLHERHDLDVRTLREHDPEVGGEELAELVAAGLIRLEGSAIALTGEGLERASRIVRRHRLAERLMADVLHLGPDEVEEAACEFEHMAAENVTDSICTLLGHPRECAHGSPIPMGSCCRAAETLPESVVPLADVPVGSRARIALVRARKDATHHRLSHLDLVPGNVVRVHQRRPAMIVAHEGNLVAMDQSLARDIHVWIVSSEEPEPDREAEPRLARAVRRLLAGGRRG